MVFDWIILAYIFGISVLFTGIIRFNAPHLGLVDLPNSRSSHFLPTPKGGGLGFVLALLGGISFLYLNHGLSFRLFFVLSSGGFLIALLGLLDDIYSISPTWRLFWQTIAVALVIFLYHGVAPLNLGFYIWRWGGVGYAVALFASLWLINLYNFMDGIDGLAAVEAILVLSAASLQIFLFNNNHELLSLFFVINAAIVGFLVWNWPPAKIFMGDCGSAFLGFLLAALIIVTTDLGLLTIWSWIILLASFWVDASVTLLRRIFNRQKWWQAHCSHAYQKLAKAWRSHRKVVFLNMLIMVCYLFPLSCCALQYAEYALVFTALAVIPLAICAFLIGAGQE